LNRWIIAALTLSLAGSGAVMAATPAKHAATKVVTTSTGLKYMILSPGTGAPAKSGTTVRMHYTGWLTSDGKTKGKKFDSSVDRGQPFEFALGEGQVIKGWDQGVPGMKVGEKRRLIIPPALGYGERGAGADIPPNATLIFDVQYLGVK
jgi:FKBP-type peptidyl-prolyl cis-trans isomerase